MQARARGFLVRREVGRAREDFEDIVNEIDGDLAHVLWSRTVIPAPRFTDVVSHLTAKCLCSCACNWQLNSTAKILTEKFKSRK